MYGIDEGLSVTSAQVTNHLDLVPVNENRIDERDDLKWMKGVTD